VATVHDTVIEMIRAHLTLVHVFHVIPHTGLSVGGHALSLLGIYEVW
jgi:hypothetical protein